METSFVSTSYINFVLVDSEEIMMGIKNKLNIHLSREEMHMLILYLDSDKSG